jgi:integrase
MTKNPDDLAERDRVLKDAELAAIWNACEDDDFGKIVRLLILTACRREEIGGLRWSEVVRDGGMMTLPKERVKNNREHVLPITPLALEIIKSVPERTGRPHLFGARSRAGGFTTWYKAKHALDSRLGKIADWNLHDIRRSVATWMAENNIEPHVIEAVLNHVSGHKSGVAGIYNRAKYAPQIRSALSRWDDHIRVLVQGRKRKIVAFSTTR